MHLEILITLLAFVFMGLWLLERSKKSKPKELQEIQEDSQKSSQECPRQEDKHCSESEKIINHCLKLALSTKAKEEVFDSVLKEIGEVLSADRCYIFDYRDGAVFNTSEWCAKGISPEIDNLQNVPEAALKAWTRAFNAHKLVKTNDLSNDTSEEFFESRRHLEPQGIKTLLACGIWSGGKLWGFVGIDFVNTKHIFTEDDERMIRAAADIFGLYLEKVGMFEALEASEAEKSLMLESIQVPVVMYDADTRIVSANSAAEKMAAMPIELLMKNPCFAQYCMHFVKEHKTGEPCPIKKCFKSGLPVVYEVTVNEREYINSANPIKNKDGSVRNVIVSMVDVTNYNESSRKLKKAMLETENAYKAKSLFLATVSHELRTPLNAVIGYSELSQDENLSSVERIENLKSINKAADSLLSLINDVLDLSKLEAGRLNLHNTPTDIKALTKELIDIFEFRARKQNIYLRQEILNEIPCLMIDAMRIKQILVNIIGNAVKFTDKGGVLISISFEKNAKDSGKLLISVKDTGMGISEDFLTKIFAPFERQAQNQVRGSYAFEGTGLGLTISSRLISEMGGQIDIKSKVDEGSEFIVSIDKLKICSQPKAVKTESAKKEIGNVDYSKKQILIVDDVEINLKVLGSMLKKFNVNFVSCLSAEDALLQISKSKPDLILTDLWMPVMSGKEFSNAIRADEKLSDIPIIAVTADTETEDIKELFDDILFKPINLANIEAILAKHLK